MRAIPAAEHALTRREGGVLLGAGWHRVRLRYGDLGGGARLAWRWTPPGEAESEVPRERLRHLPGEP